MFLYQNFHLLLGIDSQYPLAASSPDSYARSELSDPLLYQTFNYFEMYGMYHQTSKKPTDLTSHQMLYQLWP